jgi:hypothetical protein
MNRLGRSALWLLSCPSTEASASAFISCVITTDAIASSFSFGNSCATHRHTHTRSHQTPPALLILIREHIRKYKRCISAAQSLDTSRPG